MVFNLNTATETNYLVYEIQWGRWLIPLYYSLRVVTEVSPSVSGVPGDGDPPVVYLISADLGGSQTFFALHLPR